jgi:hypothetical protein
MKPPGYENLAYRRPPSFETSDYTGGYPAESRAAAAAELDDVPVRHDATGAGVFRTPDGVLHQHKNSQPPVTACNCGQFSAARGALRNGRTVRNSTRPYSRSTSWHDDVMQMKMRLLELGA